MIGAYHQLWHIEKSFRMSKHDLKARPVYHHKRESINAHLNIVFAALAVTRYIEASTGWSIKRFVRTARRYRTVQIQVGKHTITAEDPSPTTYATRSPSSTDVRTNLSRVRTSMICLLSRSRPLPRDDQSQFGQLVDQSVNISP